MKAALAAIVVSLLSSAALACADYSGSFRERGDVDYDRTEISQTKCSKLTVRMYVGVDYAEQTIATNGIKAAHTPEGLKQWELQSTANGGKKRIEKWMILQTDRNVLEINRITFPSGAVEENETLWQRL